MRGIGFSGRGQWNGVAFAAAVLLVSSFLFGGASRQHELRLALVELASLPLIIVGTTQLLQNGQWRQHTLALGVLGALLLLPLLQLAPLPPDIWTRLPGREQLALALDIVGLQPAWAPLSLTPDKTWRSFLALLPPTAMFIGILACPPGARMRILQLLLLCVLASMLLAAAQFASGGDRLYPWRTTDTGSVVGFFANRNHLATLCLLSIPFAAISGARALRHGGQAEDKIMLWFSTGLVALAIVSLGVIRSRTGIVLAGPVLAASVFGAWISSGRGRPRRILLIPLGGSALALIAVAIFALGPILERFDTVSAQEGRFENWPVVAEAANTYLPLGSGIGSFDAVFRSVEPLERLDPTFFNQAHNDYLETWLEAGWLGLAILGGFLVWFSQRAIVAWRPGISTARDLQRAASLAVGTILLHSIVDYPIRTETIAVVFALCCALLETAVQPAAGRSVRRSDHPEQQTSGEGLRGQRDRRSPNHG